MQQEIKLCDINVYLNEYYILKIKPHLLTIKWTKIISLYTKKKSRCICKEKKKHDVVYNIIGSL